MTGRSLLWFRRDLRLDDHPALHYAGRDGREVVPVFVLDPTLVVPSGAPRLAFLYRSLRALDRTLGGCLIVRHGDPAKVIPALASATKASEVVITRDFGPYGRRRDEAVAHALALENSALIGKSSPYAVAPGRVTKADGAPYSVFTPFFRAWQQIGSRPPLAGADVNFATCAVERDPIPDDPPIDCVLPEAGEHAAHERWADFVTSGLDGYDLYRNQPATAGTSRISPYLRWGQIHPRQLLADLGSTRAHDVFRKELCWRDFYADVLFHHPRTARENLQRKMDLIETDDGASARDRFAAWAAGRTGYPIVDAGMRELLATGWMHNRVRMITASFLVKDLHVPWQWGARHFMQHLVDGDLASNQHGWQWTAGSGTDAAPYFRIFNPLTQAERFDPDGDYVRRWVTEPAPPMIDHARERAEALRRYQRVTGR